MSSTDVIENSDNLARIVYAGSEAIHAARKYRREGPHAVNERLGKVTDGKSSHDLADVVDPISLRVKGAWKDECSIGAIRGYEALCAKKRGKSVPYDLAGIIALRPSNAVPKCGSAVGLATRQAATGLFSMYLCTRRNSSPLRTR